MTEWPLDAAGIPERQSTEAVRVRFCPSPTGNPHVGMIRTALFNWAHARHTGGTFVFRIEDTDSARDTEESYEQLIEAMSWLRLGWDEGPLVGGPFGPYRQSQRMEKYTDIAGRLLESGAAYRCYCTPEELEERREAARAAGRPPGYDGHCRDLTPQQREDLSDRPAVVRVRMPSGLPGMAEGRIEWDDLVRGPLGFDIAQIPDFVILRSNGEPLYTLVNPVDDVLMGITQVLRGEDLLSSTPRQFVMYEVLGHIGVGDGTVPRFGHLPYVMGEGNKKLSKRDPQSSLNLYREEGFIPEGLLNYLALLGWAIAEDRDVFSMTEMVESFDITRVNPSPARFDYKKARAINADWIRRLDVDDLTHRIVPFLQRADLLPEAPSASQLQLLRAVTPLVSERMTVLSEAVGMVGFLFASTDFAADADAVESLGADAAEVLRAADAALVDAEWSTESIEAALRSALIDGLGLKPRNAFTPVRVAVCGRRVSPPLFESLELLGREPSRSRLGALLERLEGSGAGV